MDASAAQDDEGEAARSGAHGAQPAPQEKWNRKARMACFSAFGSIIFAGLGFESLVKLYELWAERTDLEPAARPTFTFAFIAVAGAAFVAFWQFFQAAVRQGRIVMTTSRADITREAAAKPYAGLITALSTCHDHAKAREVAQTVQHRPDPKERLAAFCADADLKGVSWQQTIRGICHHVRWDQTPIVLPEVRVLLSGPNGSARQWPQFVHLFEMLFAGVPGARERIVPVGASYGIDFESYDEVVGSIEAQLSALERIVGRDKVMIDATGGQKPFSIASAVVTLRSPNQRFQYVTNRGEVTYYNASSTGQMLP
jgi:hypothetical protein